MNWDDFMSFSNCSIIYPVVPVYYCTGHLFNTISSGALKFYVGCQKIKSKSLEHCDFFDHQGHSWRSPCKTQNKIDYLQIQIYQNYTPKKQDIFVPTVCALSKQNLSRIVHQGFDHFSIVGL